LGNNYVDLWDFKESLLNWANSINAIIKEGPGMIVNIAELGK